MYQAEIKSGTSVITQGERGDKFYVIESGTFDITKSDSKSGEPRKVAERKGGQAFGDLALMYNALRAATVTAAEDCVVWITNRQTFRRLLGDINQRDTEQYTLFLDSVDLLK